MKLLHSLHLIALSAIAVAQRTDLDPNCEDVIDGTGDEGDEDYWNKGLDCKGGTVYSNAKGTGYYPSGDGVEGGCVDMRGEALRTLQDYLDGKANYVSVAMDEAISEPNYGKDICIPQLNEKYGKRIRFKVVDNGPDFDGRGGKRIDICVRTEADSLDDTINGTLDLYLNPE